MCILLKSAVVLFYGTTLSAQQQPTPAASAHNSFLLTGCLETSSGGLPAFKLTRAIRVGRAPTVRAGDGGGAAGSTAGETATYSLQPVTGLSEPGVGADVLKTHVGRRVEVTVRPIEIPPAPAPVANATVVEPAKPVEPAPERFSVTAIKPIDGACS